MVLPRVEYQRGGDGHILARLLVAASGAPEEHAGQDHRAEHQAGQDRNQEDAAPNPVRHPALDGRGRSWPAA